MAEALGISLRQLALRLGRDKGGLSRAARDGRIPRLPDGTFDEAAVRTALAGEALTDPVDAPPRQRPAVNAPVEPDVPEMAASLIRQVLAEEGEDIADASLTLTHVRMAVGILKARDQARENDVARRALIEIEEVGAVVEEEYAIIRALFTSMPGEIAIELEGLPAIEIQERLAAKVAEILTALSADGEYKAEAA